VKKLLNEETRTTLLEFATEVHDSLERNKFINMVPVESFLRGFLEQDGKTVFEFMRNNSKNGYLSCGWSLDFVMDYLEGVIGHRPHFEFWPIMEGGDTDIGVVLRFDLEGFESLCKPCFDLRLKAEKSHQLCAYHVSHALCSVCYHSAKKEEVTYERVKHVQAGYACEGHCWHGDAEWFFAVKSEDIAKSDHLSKLNANATEIMNKRSQHLILNRNKSESNIQNEQESALKKQKVNSEQ